MSRTGCSEAATVEVGACDRRSAILRLAGAVAAWIGPRRAVANDAPIKIGLLAPLTGWAAGLGKDMVTGTALGLEPSGSRMYGRHVHLLVEDEEGNPAVALTKARKLVEADRVHLLTGGLQASTGYALRSYIDGQRVVTTYPVIAADDLTQRKPSRWIVRTGWSVSQPMHAFGDWVVRKTPYRRIATIGMDFAFGWESVSGFQRVFEEQGGRIVQKVWTPINTSDYAPFLAAIRRDVDAVFAVFAGAAALQFVKQYREGPRSGPVPLLGAGTTTDETVLDQMGDEAIGTVTALHYSATLGTRENRQFAGRFEAKTGRAPSYYAEACYTNARWIAEAVRALEGRIEDREALLRSLKATKLTDSARGPLSVDDWGNPVQNVYIRRVERVADRLQNTVIETIPAVGQFWKYRPEEYLALPPYSRSYPPCGHC